MSRRETNLSRLDQAQLTLAEAAEECLAPGWYGEITIRLPIEDGVLQRMELRATRHIRPAMQKPTR